MTDLNNGILLEDTNEILFWGKSIKSIIRDVNCEVENQGDRTIYHWGNHVILNGLNLNLSSKFWKFGKDRWIRKLKQIDYWAIGDKIADEEFKRISEHLTNIFGPPQEKRFDDNEKSLKWIKDGVKFDLFFFEQHCYKLHLGIVRII